MNHCLWSIAKWDWPSSGILEVVVLGYRPGSQDISRSHAFHVAINESIEWTYWQEKQADQNQANQNHGNQDQSWSWGYRGCKTSAKVSLLSDLTQEEAEDLNESVLEWVRSNLSFCHPLNKNHVHQKKGPTDHWNNLKYKSVLAWAVLALVGGLAYGWWHQERSAVEDLNPSKVISAEEEGSETGGSTNPVMPVERPDVPVPVFQVNKPKSEGDVFIETFQGPAPTTEAVKPDITQDSIKSETTISSEGEKELSEVPQF